ncbi:MAG: diacylglycerol kinase [Flavobacterium sp.]|uniref:diacylglycerol/lipid kinase family protein n=1 Tax=unclassified Flavobacterium TaxID=196869 RepID=UPI000C35843C|nr:MULTISPECIES: diacylglycerol kinase family protein [unclassified Flavobacterium]MBF01729.1 diacylglycerol kinase [Flavobacterium sp.]MCO6162385.1 diacylglycerol kinase [Flavobacterium sp. NRK F7]
MSFKNIYLLVVNPISGDKDKATLIAQVRDFAQEIQQEILVYETTGNEDEVAIQKLYQKHQPVRVLIAGGDGTIKMVGEALEQEDVVFGIIPAGSANGLSIDLNLPSSVEENIKIAFQNDYIEIDMVEINGKKSLHLSDLGLNALLVKNYEKSDTRGKLGYALQVITTLTEADDEPFEVVIKTTEGVLHTNAKMIVIANSQKYGTGVTINPNGKIDDGKFEIVVLKSLDVFTIGKIVTGNILSNTEEVSIFSTDQAVITTQKKISFQIDGEYCGEEDELKVGILPAQMKVAVP